MSVPIACHVVFWCTLGIIVCVIINTIWHVTKFAKVLESLKLFEILQEYMFQ